MQGSATRIKALVKRTGVVPNIPYLANQFGALCSLQNADLFGLGSPSFAESTVEAVGSTLEVDVVAGALPVSPAHAAHFEYSRS